VIDASLAFPRSACGPGDRVIVECGCGHTETLTSSMLATAGVRPEVKVLDLGRRLRCRECDERGRVDISILWSRERV
jgi:hypothetical protein